MARCISPDVIRVCEKLAVFEKSLSGAAMIPPDGGDPIVIFVPFFSVLLFISEAAMVEQKGLEVGPIQEEEDETSHEDLRLEHRRA